MKRRCAIEYGGPDCNKHPHFEYCETCDAPLTWFNFHNIYTAGQISGRICSTCFYAHPSPVGSGQ